MATSSAPRLVDITDGEFRLDITALAEVLCQPSIEDRPVAVVGIAGPMRTGKSFALSFLMRYLRNKGWKSPGWIGNGNTNANDDGIEWRGGRNPDTRGIRVWNEPLFVEKNDGDELAVILVDTQGLFDKTMTRENNMRLLTFTVLLCSRLMFNIKDQINEQDLGHLQFFTEYAKTVLEEFKGETPFQDLMFLVRDWQYPDDDPFGAVGGKSYLSEVFKLSGNSEVDCVRRDLRSAFGSIEAFLMPYPGMNVVNPDFQGHNSDLDPDFLSCIKDLAHVVFHPKTLKERKHNGRAMTGRQLWSLLEASNRAFKDGAVPAVKNMVEGFARMNNRLACEDGLKIFDAKFEEKSENSDKDLTYREAQDAAIQYFDGNTKFGPENFRQEYRIRLISDCQDRFRRITAWDECRKLKAKNTSAQILHKVWTEYKDAMKTDVKGEYTPDDVIGKLHAKHLNAALLKYQTETAKEVSFYDDHLQLLENMIETSYSKLKTVNEERYMLVTLGSQTDLTSEYEAYLFLHTISQQYREEFEKFAGMYIEENKLKGQVEWLQQSYLEIFSENWVREGPNIDAFRKSFLQLVQDEWKDCMEENERNKDVFDNSIEECLMRTKVQYEEEMHQLVDRTYCEPSNLQKAHDSIVSKLTGSLSNNLAELEVSERTQVLDKAQQDFSSIFTYYMTKNDGNRLEKPPINWKMIQKIMEDVSKGVAVVTLAIRRFTAVVGTLKSAKSAVKTLVSAKILPPTEALVAVAPYVALAGAAATITVVAYCVYTHYKNRQVVQNR